MSLVQAAKSQAKAEIEDLENLLKLSEQLVKENRPGREYIEESKNLLTKANAQLQNLEVGRNPWKLTRIAFAADTIGNYLSSVRYNLVYIVPREKLPLLVANARREIFYVPESEQEAETGRLNSALNSIEDSAENIVDAGFRNKLASVVASISEHKKAAWHRSSILRSRLMTMLFVLGSILLLCYFLIPLSITDWSAAGEVGRFGNATANTGTVVIKVLWCHVLFIVMAVEFLGALGGALSSMQSRPEGILHLHDLYVQETLMYLRPAVGASAALGLTLMQIAGVMELFPPREGSFGINVPVLLFVAFLAGFSERFFVRQIETFVDRKPGESGQ